jgi:hypothetical protein
VKGSEKIKTFSKIVKNSTLLLAVIVFFAGFGIGIYVTLIFQKQTTVFGISAIVIAIFSGLGALVSLANRIMDWHSNNKEKEKVPVLKFDDFYKTIGPLIQTYAPDYKEHVTCFVRIIDTNSKSEGQVENANGFLEVKGRDAQRSITRTPTVWSVNNSRSLSFSKRADLMLFTAIGTERIIFPIANKEEGYKPNTKPYSNFINEELIIEVDCKGGILKEKTRTMKISEIINTSNLEEA